MSCHVFLCVYLCCVFHVVLSFNVLSDGFNIGSCPCMSCCVLSFNVFSILCHVFLMLSYFLTSCRVLSFQSVSFLFISFYLLSFLGHVMSFLVMSCFVLLYLLMSSLVSLSVIIFCGLFICPKFYLLVLCNFFWCHFCAMPCVVLCFIMSGRVIACYFIPCQSNVTSCHFVDFISCCVMLCVPLQVMSFHSTSCCFMLRCVVFVIVWHLALKYTHCCTEENSQLQNEETFSEHQIDLLAAPQTGWRWLHTHTHTH